MDYKEMIKVIAEDGRSIEDRSNIVIREMCRLIGDICDYDYTVNHYKGDGTAVEDKRNQIKNSLALVMSDLDIYAEQLGITTGVKDKAYKRLKKLTDKRV